jgi:hypothetical protein
VPELDQDQAAAAAAELSPDQQLDVLTDEITRRQARKVAREAGEAEHAKATGQGPCSRCGASESWPRPGVGGWAGGDQHGAICWPCDVERGGPSGDDREARIRTCRRVMGSTPAPPWAGHGDLPAVDFWHDDWLADVWRWWYETAGAPPGRGPERFAYTSGPELVARLYEGREPRPPELHSRGRRHRCPGCGARGQVWTCQQTAMSAPLTTTGELGSQRGYFRIVWTCSRCRHEDVERQPEQMPGVAVSGLVG